MTSALPQALLVFFMRMSDISLYTLRILMVRRSRRLLAWIFAFCQSLLFVSAVQIVLRDASNWTKVLGYAAGFATGLVVGMSVEERLAIGSLQVRIISAGRGNAIVEALRQRGFGATLIPAFGRVGEVDMIYSDIPRRAEAELERLVRGLDDNAFIAYEEVTPLQKGYWGRSNR
ncbi:MAG: DUF5698 domain-containing protein [Anaerolineales bacterium]|nr:DUF5698 domain-containing protein [Anaerolineales bacterium]